MSFRDVTRFIRENTQVTLKLLKQMICYLVICFCLIQISSFSIQMLKFNYSCIDGFSSEIVSLLVQALLMTTFLMRMKRLLLLVPFGAVESNLIEQIQLTCRHPAVLVSAFACLMVFSPVL